MSRQGFSLMTGSAWILLIWLATAPAQQNADPLTLTALRQRYQILLKEAEAPPKERWLAALESREKQLAAAGDYEGAALVRAQRIALLSGKSVSEGAVAQTQPVVLTAQTARTSTGVDFVDARKEVVRFRRLGSSLEWDLPAQTPGTFQINLICGVMGSYDQSSFPDPYRDPAVPLPVRTPAAMLSGAAGGVVEFRRLTAFKHGGTALRCSVRSTGGWAAEKSLPLGKVDLDGKAVTFSLRAVDALPGGVMDFRRIEFVPDVATGRVAAGTGGIKDLVRLQDVYQKEFFDQTRPVTARYLKGLTDLEVSSAKIKDNDTLALVRREKERMGQDGSTGPPVELKEGMRTLPVTQKLYMLVKGEAKLTSQGDYLTRLRPAGGCEVTWKLAGLGVTSGTYKVSVEYRAGLDHGGSAEIFAATPGGPDGPHLTLNMPGSPGAAQTITLPGVVRRRTSDNDSAMTTGLLPVGSVTIPKGSEYLTLRVTSLAVPDGGLFELKSLQLVPEPAKSP